MIAIRYSMPFRYFHLILEFICLFTLACNCCGMDIIGVLNRLRIADRIVFASLYLSYEHTTDKRGCFGAENSLIGRHKYNMITLHRVRPCNSDRVYINCNTDFDIF